MHTCRCFQMSPTVSERHWQQYLSSNNAFCVLTERQSTTKQKNDYKSLYVEQDCYK